MAWEPILSLKNTWQPILSNTSSPKDSLDALPISNPVSSTKTSTPAVASGFGGLSPSVFNPIPLAQGVARSVASAGITVGNAAAQLAHVPAPFPSTIPTTGSPITSALFGGQPITTLQQQTQNLKPSAGGFAAPLVLGGVLLDLSGLGGESGAVKSAIRATTAEEAVNILTKAGAPEDVAKLFAPRVIATKTPEEAKALFSDVAKYKAPNAVEDLAPITAKASQSLPEAEQAGRTVIEAAQKPSPLVDTVLKESGSDISSKAVDSGINVGRLLISPEGKSLVTQTVKDIKPQIEGLVGKTLTNKEALVFAENTSKTLKSTIGREETLAWESGMLRARQQLAKASESGAVDEEYIKNLLLVKTQATDIARKLQSLSIGAEPIERGGKQAIVEAVLKVSNDSDAIIKAAEGVNFQDLRQATEFYRKFVKPTAGEWTDLLRYNSMLSSPLTHIINITSNALNTALIAPLEKALTGGLDFLGSKLTGKGRSAFAAEGAQYYKHYLLNVKKAFGNLADVMTGKKLYTNLDTRSIPIATKGVKGALVSTLAYPSRLLEGMDQFFMTLGEGGERGALAYRAGKGVKTDVEELARKAAEYRIYRQKPGEKEQGFLLGAVDELTNLIQRARNSKNPVLSVPAKFTLPFLQTPMNILKQGIEFSPLGFATLPGAANKTEQLSRAILGSTVFAGAATFLTSNRLTFGEPTDVNGKRDFRAAKQQPYSIKVGDTWYSYQKLPPPLSFPFVMVASINQAVQEKKLDEGTADVVLSVIAKYGQFLSDQSYVKSIGDIISSFSGGEAGVANVISNYAQQLIPFRAFGGWMARLGDPVQRKIDSNGSLLEKQIQLLMLNVPGLSGKVPARLDAEGKPIEAPNPVGNAISPVHTTVQTAEQGRQYEALQAYKKDKQIATEQHSKEKDAVQPIYDKVQELLRAGDNAGAQAVVRGLSDADYKTYQDLKASDHAANTTFLRTMLHVAPVDAVKFLRSQIPSEQQRLIKVLTDDEYKLYEEGKKPPAEGGPQAINTGPSLSDVFAVITGARVAHASEKELLGVQPQSLADRLTGTSTVVNASKKVIEVPDKVLAAFANNETGIVPEGEKYTSSQPSGDPTLGRALGKYRVTEGVLKQHSERYLGRQVSPKEFLASPELQDKFMRNRIAYLQSQGYTLEQIADIHRSGSTTTPGSSTYKSPGYVKKFSTYLQSQ